MSFPCHELKLKPACKESHQPDILLAHCDHYYFLLLLCVRHAMAQAVRRRPLAAEAWVSL
jgi:hypothetical protein